MSRFALTLALLPLLATTAVAAPLSTDRPDMTETSQVVGDRAYQLEQGVQVLTGPAGPVGVFPSLHRYGLGDRLELRLETPLVEFSGGQAAFPGGALGAKWRLWDGGEPGQAPSGTLLGHLVIEPTGPVGPHVRFLTDYALPEDLDLSVNLGASTIGGQTDWDTAVALGYEVTEAWSTYLEGWRGEPIGAADVGHGVDWGVRCLIDQDTQLDMAIYKGLGGGAPDWGGTLGLSKRWGP